MPTGRRKTSVPDPYCVRPHRNSMSKQIIINTDSQKTRIAIVEQGELAELFIETEEHERTLGNLVVGRVRRIMPSIQAAFVDIGQKQDAFLHFSDLSENLADWLAYLGEETPEIGKFKPQHLTAHKGRKRRRPLHGRPHGEEVEEDEDEDDLELDEDVEGQDEDEEDGETDHHAIPDARLRGRRRSIQRRSPSRHEDEHDDDEPVGPPVHSLLQRDQSILVKISKEPIAQKGSRITTDISLAGRFLVLVPMANYVAVSKKIASFKERRRLRILAKSLLPDGFGVIVRTVAQNQTAKTLDTDLRLLVERWQKIEAKLVGHPKSPHVVYEDVNMVSSVIRDLFSDTYDKIVVDNPRLYRNVKSYIQAVAPDMAVSVVLHQSDEPIFRTAGIERKVAEAFERRINLPSGAYLFFEQTEAMHVIDVNSGRAGKGLSQEDSSLKVNLEAARAIAHQMRLRDLGGIVVVDFIDLRHERNRRKVYEELRKEFRSDRAVTKLLPMSDFGLIQITRQRLRPSITTTFSELHDQLTSDEAPSRESRGVGEPAERRVSLPAMHMADAATPETLIGDFEDWIRAYRRAGFRAPVRLRVHPFVAAYLNDRLPGQSTRWYLRFLQRVRIESDLDADVVTWQMLDQETGEDVTRVPVRPPTAKRAETPVVETQAPTRDDRETGGADRDGRRDGRGRRDSDRRGGRSEDRRDGGRSDRRDSRGGERRDDRPRDIRSGERRDDRPRDERDGERRDDRPRDERGGERRDDRPRNERGGERREERPRPERGGERRDDRPREEGREGRRPERSVGSVDDRSGDRPEARPDERPEERSGDRRTGRREQRPGGRREPRRAEPGIDSTTDEPTGVPMVPPIESGAEQDDRTPEVRRSRGGRGRRPAPPPDMTPSEGATEPAPGEGAVGESEASGGPSERRTRRRGGRGRGGRGHRSGGEGRDEGDSAPDSEPSGE